MTSWSLQHQTFILTIINISILEIKLKFRMSGKDVEIISEIRTTEGTESSNGDARTELTSEEDSESSDSVDHYTTNEPRPQFYRPCCTTMQTAMYLIGGGEVVRF